MVAVVTGQQGQNSEGQQSQDSTVETNTMAAKLTLRVVIDVLGGNQMLTMTNSNLRANTTCETETTEFKGIAAW